MTHREEQPASRPPRLKPGARVALIAPAGPVPDPRIDAALERVTALGLEPALGSAVRDRCGYLAGTDESRARDLDQALEDPSIDAIWALRGGYGAMRLLDGLDLKPLRDRPRAFIGFSDNTALHVAIGRAGIVSFHGPHAGGEWTEIVESTFQRVLFEAKPAGVLPLPDGNAESDRPITLTGGSAEGELAGGNLSLLAALCGTPFAFDARERIVTLEDVGEAVYRIDRALTQLLLSGCLDGAAGLALGRFTRRPQRSEDGRELEDVLGEVATRLGVPAVYGFPIGHSDDNWCLPLRVRARLDADDCTLEVLEPAVA